MARRSQEPLKLLLRHEDPDRLLTFFRSVSEGFSAAFADAAAKMPATPKNRPAIYAQGAIRRCFMDQAFRDAAQKAGLVAAVRYTNPPTWCFPTLRLGAFSLTLGVVDRIRAGGPRQLRNKGKYVKRHAKNNEIANPQTNLFHDEETGIRRVIPNGSLGAMIVTESSVHAPDTPLWIGFWLPSPNLKNAYFRCSIDTLLAFLREQQLERRQVRRAVGQPVERKKPVLKPAKKRKPKKG